LDDLEKKQGTDISSYFNPIHNLHYLYNKLIEPVKNLLEGCNILYIIPHGVLSDLPFHALLSPDGTALIDEQPLAYSPSLAVLRQCLEHNRSNLGTCFASGVDSSNGGPINAKDEAALVAQFFNTLPMPANRVEFNSHAGSCDVIHLACHGITSESWPGNVVTAFQGLRLEDGPLYQREIVNIECKSSLVVLSACETARGDVLKGNEMAGLIGSFIRAGAPSVIASLWPLADSVAKPFAEEFYKALKHDNLSKAQALQQAQKRIKSQGNFSHPYFWAPFCLWGAA
jgi:CHAT domain-containing protein